MGWTARNGYLTQAEMEGNATEVANYLTNQGWSLQAICATLGNMQAESGVNPGIWENLIPYGTGYGLTQWTPYTKLSTWATARGLTWENDGETQCMMLDYESINNEQWFYNAELGIAPPITFSQFSTSTLDVHTLTNYFLWFYEHPTDPGTATQIARQSNADYWWNFLGGSGTTIPLWLLFKFKDWRKPH